MKCDKVIEDSWLTSPPQVTSVITFTRLSNPAESSAVVHTSSTCGLGWRFHVVEKYLSKLSDSNPRPQNESLVATVQLSFHPPPPLFTVFALNVAAVYVQVVYPDSSPLVIHEQKFYEFSLKDVHQLGSYEEPPQYKGQTHIIISLMFDASYDLSFPITPHPKIQDVLSQSLDDPSFIDTKFYLFSAKRRSLPVVPKAVYGQSRLFAQNSYLESLLSSYLGFSCGTPCLIREETPKAIAELKAEAYDYYSDSDLESLPDDEDDHGKEKSGQEPRLAENLPVNAVAVEGDKNIELMHSKQITDSPEGTDAKKELTEAIDVTSVPAAPSDGRAFAINGTAYKTWKAFILYSYTNNIQFTNLKSENKPNDNMKTIRCSPKSMYRLADYVDSLWLKSLAKDGIRQRLSKSNIITELFSTFTYRYREIIEMETDYFLREFDSNLAQKLDEILQLVVAGSKPHSHRVLVFLMRRHRGESTEEAWKALANNGVGSLFSNTKDNAKNPFEIPLKLDSGPRLSHSNRHSSRVSRSQQQTDKRRVKRHDKSFGFQTPTGSATRTS